MASNEIEKAVKDADVLKAKADEASKASKADPENNELQGAAAKALSAAKRARAAADEVIRNNTTPEEKAKMAKENAAKRKAESQKADDEKKAAEQESVKKSIPDFDVPKFVETLKAGLEKADGVIDGLVKAKAAIHPRLKFMRDNLRYAVREGERLLDATGQKG